MGLFSQQNSFQVPDGALEQASNIVISRDQVVSKRRGFYQYYDPGVSTLNALFLYQNRLVAAFTDKLAYLTDTGSAPNITSTATTLTGATVAITNNRVSRSVQSNNNLYMTSDNGVLKLESFSGTIYKAGTPPALDLVARFIAGTNGPINTDSQTAWRVVFGRRDSNDNLILGAPSDIVSLTNAKVDNVSYSVGGTTITVTSTAHGLTTGDYITVSDASATPSLVNGAFQITVTGVNSFTYTTGSGASGGTLDYVVNYKTRLEFSVPSEITTVADGYFYQVYRTTSSLSSSTTPDPNWKLVEELKLTAGQITAKLVSYDDTTDSLLLDAGAELYTNPNSREGETQANARPPLCDDVTFYKNHVIYGKCTTRHLLDLAVIDSAVMTGGDYVEVKVDGVTRRYVARTGVGNSTVTGTVTGSGTITITYAAHGLVNGDTVYVDNVVGGAFAAGTYTVAAAAANTFQITGSGTATALDFQGVTNGTYPIFQLNNAGSSASLRLRETASGLVKAINRDASSVVYGDYVSGLTDIPGKLRLTAKGFGGAIYVRANSTTAGSAFSPPLPDSFSSGDQVFSRNDSQPHVIYVSKIGEPEAVPIVNFFPVGARNAPIRRIVALRDSVIILKDDGVFRLNGDTVTDFSITVLDNTVFCIEASSVALLNNEVYSLTNQGVCRISDNAVAVVSRKIEDPIAAIVGSSSLPNNAQAVTYESERLYLLSTIEANMATNSVVYAYNALNDTWVTWDTTFKQGVIGPSDTLYLVTTGNKISKERKNQTRIDYCGQNYAVTINTVASDGLSATITPTGKVPEAGDVIVKSDVFSRIKSVTGAAAPYAVTFDRQSNVAAADSLILYAKYDSTIKLAPFHAGLVGRWKQFAQMQIHTRDENVSALDISFTGNQFGGSELVTWRASSIGAGGGGWGSQPWGFFPWGEGDGINKTFGTRNAPIIRIYVPLFQQRVTFLQPVLEHKQAGESINMQALSFAVRNYGERVSR